MGQQPGRARETRRSPEVLGRPGRGADPEGQAVLLLHGEPGDGYAALQPDWALRADHRALHHGGELLVRTLHDHRSQHRPTFPGNVIPQSRIDPVSAPSGSSTDTLRATARTTTSSSPTSGRCGTSTAAWTHRLPEPPPDLERLLLTTRRPRPMPAYIRDRPPEAPPATRSRGAATSSDFLQTVFDLDMDLDRPSQSVRGDPRCHSDAGGRAPEDSLGTTSRPRRERSLAPPGAPEIPPTIQIGECGAAEAVLFNGWTTDFTVKNVTSSRRPGSWARTASRSAEFQDGNFNTIKPARENSNGMSFNGNVTSNGNPSAGVRRHFRPRFRRLPAGPFDTYGQGDGSTRRSILEPGSYAGHLARDASSDRHRPPGRDEQRDQRDREPADAVSTRASRPSSRTSQGVGPRRRRTSQ